MLELNNLSYQIEEKFILKDISFKIEAGQVISFFGPSGCGKTTILRLIMLHLQKPNLSIKNSFKKISCVFQEPRLIPWYNVIDNVKLVCNKKNLSIVEIKEICFKLGLTEQDLIKYPAQLSGGMKQRVAFARAFITKPDLLLLDEAFSGLDFQLKLKLQDLINEEISSNKLAVIQVSHDAFEVLKISDYIYKLGGNPSTINNTIQLKTSYIGRDFAYIQSKIELLQN